MCRLGYKLSDEHRQKLRNAWKNRVVSKETCLKISKTLSGRKLSEENKIRIGLANKGKVRSTELKNRLSALGAFKRTNELNGNWKGEQAGYSAIHYWVRRKLGSPIMCRHCGKQGRGHQIQWANISNEYKRDFSDWMTLCCRCHKNYDIGNLTLEEINKKWLPKP